ncbi:hypothetical protein HDE68_003755 [Pedobacter cryoconitis]|uniref:Uncharacterized protein n=1 Tax=Pedobacter cryoconitis TaxID=188932 RepID=A0A7W8ZPV7_9SPHI|nr:hypothetical protein [Pedobacter cryoconitis]MBB5637830.1 hypothetical protein [Pedobacter cryoconitis]
MARAWYVYIGNGPLKATNYYKIPPDSIIGCLNGDLICTISAVDTGDENPESPLSPNLQKYILDGLSTQLAQPEGNRDTKKYVYMKY